MANKDQNVTRKSLMLHSINRDTFTNLFFTTQPIAKIFQQQSLLKLFCPTQFHPILYIYKHTHTINAQQMSCYKNHKNSYPLYLFLIPFRDKENTPNFIERSFFGGKQLLKTLAKCHHKKLLA